MGFASWWAGLQQRLSRNDPQLELGLRNLYILPSAFGGLWLLAVGLLYGVGINSRSNSPVLLGFFMTSLMLLSLFLTHFNLQGLRLGVLPQTIGFTETATYYWIESNSRIWRPSLKLRWLRSGAPKQQLLHIPPGCQHWQLPFQSSQRGWQLPGQLLIHTSAPLGLFRCWAYWEPPEPIVLAPAPINGPVAHVGEPSAGPLADQWLGLEPWRAEQGPQRLDWKTLARGKGWHCKNFVGEEHHHLWLKPIPNVPIERALEHLCATLLAALDAGFRVGLELPGSVSIPPGKGKAHRERCLLALAEVPSERQQRR